MDVPLSSDDLHRIGTLVEKWNELLIDKDGNFTDVTEGIGDKIPVNRPDDNDQIGWLILEDGWVGFQFETVK